MEDWKAKEKEAKQRKELQKQYPLLGKKARRKGRGNKWEEGIIVLSKFDWSEQPELFIKFAEDDLEQLFGLPFQILNESTGKWEEG